MKDNPEKEAQSREVLEASLTSKQNRLATSQNGEASSESLFLNSFERWMDIKLIRDVNIIDSVFEFLKDFKMLNFKGLTLGKEFYEEYIKNKLESRRDRLGRLKAGIKRVDTRKPNSIDVSELLSNRNPVGKRLKDKLYYQRHKERIKKIKLERQKIRYVTDRDYKFRQDVEAGHRSFKKQLLAKFNHKCVNCGGVENLQLHHIRYVKGKEGIPFVLVLCKPCHLKIHYPLPEAMLVRE